MAVDESRLQEIEKQIHELDKRQASFEVRFDMYMKKTDELIRLQREQTNRLDAKIDKVQTELSAQMHNLLVAGGIGFFTVVVTIILTK